MYYLLRRFSRDLNTPDDLGFNELEENMNPLDLCRGITPPDIFDSFGDLFKSRQEQVRYQLENDKDNLEITIEVPGVEPTIKINDGILTVVGKPTDITKIEREIHKGIECQSTIAKFAGLELRLPAECDVSNIKAYTKNGMLHITIPKLETAVVGKEIAIEKR